MYKIKMLNKISPAGLAELGGNFVAGSDVTGEDGILVRSADMHGYGFPASCGPSRGRGGQPNTSP